mmetsp:Transcript_97/g.365  ORF Transcript_97/g.365 Transcript_97/m.365 type:complete len:81 (+) Transcript_97:1138-1380(+)
MCSAIRRFQPLQQCQIPLCSPPIINKHIAPIQACPVETHHHADDIMMRFFPLSRSLTFPLHTVFTPLSYSDRIRNMVLCI